MDRADISAVELRQPKLVSVIIPVRDGASVLGAQLTALAKQDFDGAWEVIVIDNGSQDGSAEVARRFAAALPQVRILSAPHQRGASHARNVGAASAGGDFLAFCDADDVVTSQWLSALVRTAGAYDVVGGAIRSPQQSGTSASELDAAAGAHGLPTAGDFLPHVFSLNCGFWSSTLSSLGGWNERYLIGEDVEISWRAHLQGYRIGFASDAIVWRYDPPSTVALMRRSFGYGKAGAHLHREFRTYGARSNLLEAARAVGWLIRNGPRAALSDGDRRRWANVLGRRVGRLAGSIRYRTFYP